MRISDWSSDVCSSDLGPPGPAPMVGHLPGPAAQRSDRRAAQGRATDREVPQRRRPVRLPHRGAGPGLGFDVQALYMPVRRKLPEFPDAQAGVLRSEEHTSELQSLMRISYAVFCL